MILAKIFGVRFKINPLFFIVLLLYAAGGLLIEAFILFSIVILHEIWHAFVALGHGFDIEEIELLPFGGVAKLKGIIEINPEGELKTALAGPVCNIVIAAVTMGAAGLFYKPGPYMDFFIVANISVGLFNLVPIVPLDGGRVLRAILVKEKGFKEGTRIAVNIGRTLLLVFALAIVVAVYIGFLNVISLSIIVFLFMAQRHERSNSTYVLFRYLINRESDILSDRVMAVAQLVATKDVTIREVLLSIKPEKYHMIVVLDSNLQMLGMIGEKQLLESFISGNADMPLEVLL